MPGFDKVGAYQMVDSNDKEDESNLQYQSQSNTDNIKGMYIIIINYRIKMYLRFLFKILSNSQQPFKF